MLLLGIGQMDLTWSAFRTVIWTVLGRPHVSTTQRDEGAINSHICCRATYQFPAPVMRPLMPSSNTVPQVDVSSVAAQSGLAEHADQGFSG